jgi:hypothetical protein
MPRRYAHVTAAILATASIVRNSEFLSGFLREREAADRIIEIVPETP